MDELLSVKFTHSNTVHERRPYTIYEIEVRSSSTITWVIYKRYSSFDDLHDQLQKFIQQNISIFGPIKLPILPPKRMTRSLAAEFVEKRKMELQDFLRHCLQISVLVSSDVLLNFLEVPDSVRPMLARPNPSAKSVQNNDQNTIPAQNSIQGSSSGDVGRYGGHTIEEKMVIELITSLRSSTTKVAAIRQFEGWFFRTQSSNNRTRLSTEYIRILFEGQPDVNAVSTTSSSTAPAAPPRKQNQTSVVPPPSVNGVGLVAVCGDFRHSRCAARAALCLISRLCDPERNKDSSVYVDQFATLPPSLLQKMRLQNHIFTTRGNRPAAFSIVHALQQYVEARSPTSTSTNGQNNDITLEYLIQEPWARQEYIQWLRVKNAQHLRTTQTTHEHSSTMSLFLRGNTLAAYRPLIQAGFEQLLGVCSLETGWYEIEVSSSPPPNIGTTTTSNGSVIGNPHTSNITSPIAKTPATPSMNRQTSHSSAHHNQYTHIPRVPSAGGGGTGGGSTSPQLIAGGPNSGPNSMKIDVSLANDIHDDDHSIEVENLPSAQIGPNGRLHLPISISYQRDPDTNNLLFRSCALLPFSVQKVNSILSVPDLLPLWDTKINSAHVTHQFDISSDILHLVYYTNGSFYRQKDFALLRSVTQLQDGSIILLCRSVNIPSCGEVKGYQRCSLAPSGYIISPISPTESLVTHILQLDQDSVLLYAADLLGESHEVKTSWYNLVTLLEAVVD